MGLDEVIKKAWRWENCEKIDVLKGTRLERYAEEWGFGLSLFRAKIPKRYVGTWAVQCGDMFRGLTYAKKVGKRNGAYDSVQCTLRNCTCKDPYAGVHRHRVVHLPDPNCGVLSEMLRYMHTELGVRNGDEMEMNQVVANRYEVYRQNVPYHSDTSKLLGENPTIISISLGATAAFCYAPDYTTKFGQACANAVTRQEMKFTQITGRLKEAEVEGMVVLRPGDILVMWGTFQDCFVHKTLRNDALKNSTKFPTLESLLERYPAVNDRIRADTQRFWRHVQQTSEEDLLKELRFCVTLRRIKHHIMHPRCPCVPGIMVCGGVDDVVTSPGACATTPSTMTPTTTRSTRDSGTEVGQDSEWCPWPQPEDRSMVSRGLQRESARVDRGAEGTQRQPVRLVSRQQANARRTNKRLRGERADDRYLMDPKETIDVWRTSITLQLAWYHPGSASRMCEEVLGKGASSLDEMERWIEGAKKLLGYLEDQVNDWEGGEARVWWKDYGMKDAEADGYLAFLRESKAFMDQAVVVGELNAKGIRKLRTLRTFNESRKVFDVVSTPESRLDKRWFVGTNTGTSRAYRVTLPLWYFEDIFRQADLEYFGQYGGVRVHYMKLRDPWQGLYILRRTSDGRDELRPLRWDMIGRGPFVEVRTIEMALDYTSNMCRYQILQPNMHGMPAERRPAKVQEMLNEWVDVVRAVKEAQMQCTARPEWPADCMLPWWPTCLEWMPVVCWLRKQDSKTRR